MNRRHFITRAAAATAAIGAAGRSSFAAVPSDPAPSGTADEAKPLPRVTHPGERRGEMLYRPLGGTGEQVSVIGLGGSHLGKPGLAAGESLRLMHAAIDRGITFLDNSWDYNEGESELRMGEALSQGGYRDKVFLMTKIDGRTKEAAKAQIDTSLRRLQTDRIDLLQHHEILRFDDPDRIFAEDGAMEAFLEAKQAGKIRHIGFTGHKDPHIHLHMLETAAQHGFHFDAVQMPLNVMDAHFRSFGREVLPRLVSENIGVLGMKTFGGADGIILKSKAVDPVACLHYSLTLPTSVVITGIDNQKVLDQAFAAVASFQPLDDSQLATLLAQTRDLASAGGFELFKTTAHFDTTARHADWLGGETPAIRKLAPQNAG